MVSNQQFDTKWSQTLASDKTEEFSVFVRVGEKARTQRQLFLHQYYTLIRAKVGNAPLHDVLEMGCGRGTVSLYFALYDKVRTSLCDLSASAVELAKANYVFHGAEGNIVESPAEKTPFAGNTFDVVFSIGLLEHLDDYSPVVQEKFRVLKSGGLVASLNIPKKGSIQILNTWYRNALRLFGYKGELKKDYYRNSQTPEQYLKVFQDAGFVDCEIMYVTPFPLFTPLPKVVERGVTLLYRSKLFFRGLFFKYPFATNRYIAQAHFIFGHKP